MIDDIALEDKSLTNNDRKNILQILKCNHDASIGINWDVIRATVDIYKQDRQS